MIWTIGSVVITRVYCPYMTEGAARHYRGRVQWAVSHCFVVFCRTTADVSSLHRGRKGGHAVAITKPYQASLGIKTLVQHQHTDQRFKCVGIPLRYSATNMKNGRLHFVHCNIGSSDTTLSDVCCVIRSKFVLAVSKLYRVIPLIDACTSGDTNLHCAEAFYSLSRSAVHSVVCMCQQ